jgi:hypothetical protein
MAEAACTISPSTGPASGARILRLCGLDGDPARGPAHRGCGESRARPRPNNQAIVACTKTCREVQDISGIEDIGDKRR